jgi:hypothetical protein
VHRLQFVRRIKQVSDEQRDHIVKNARNYWDLAGRYH